MSPPLRGDTSRGDRGLGPPSYAPMDMNVDCIWLFDTLNMNVRDGYKYAVGRLLNYGQNCTLIQKKPSFNPTYKSDVHIYRSGLHFCMSDGHQL